MGRSFPGAKHEAARCHTRARDPQHGSAVVLCEASRQVDASVDPGPRLDAACAQRLPSLFGVALLAHEVGRVARNPTRFGAGCRSTVVEEHEQGAPVPERTAPAGASRIAASVRIARGEDVLSSACSPLGFVRSRGGRCAPPVRAAGGSPRRHRVAQHEPAGEREAGPAHDRQVAATHDVPSAHDTDVPRRERARVIGGDARIARGRACGRMRRHSGSDDLCRGSNGWDAGGSSIARSLTGSPPPR
jgi:hypothetical protein